MSALVLGNLKNMDLRSARIRTVLKSAGGTFCAVLHRAAVF